MKIAGKFFPQYFGFTYGIAIFVGYLLASISAKSGFSFGVGFLEGLLNIHFSELFTTVNFSHSLEIFRIICGHVAGGAVIVSLLWFFSKKLALDLWKEIGWVACHNSLVLWGIFWGSTLSLGILLARYILFSDLPRTSFVADGINVIFWGISSLLLVPIIEEVLFRGVLYLGMLNSWGQTWAFGSVTILFSLGHLVYFPSGKFPPLFIFIVYTMSGVGMLLLRMQSNSLFPSIAFHCSFNLVWVLHVFSRLSPIVR